MKWNKLPDKEPPFNTTLIVWREKDEWGEADLEKIECTQAGKIFTFQLAEELEGFSITDATHWAIPTKPKE